MELEPNGDCGSLPIDPDVRRRIESYARTVGTTPAEVVRQAFEQYQESHRDQHAEDAEQTAFDVMSRAGLIGCVPSDSRSPTDLSTNPKYMEGFGRG